MGALLTNTVYTKLEETKSCKCVASPRASPHLPGAAWQIGDSFTHGKRSVLTWYGSWAAHSPAVQWCLLVIQTIQGWALVTQRWPITSLMRLFLAHRACALIRDRTHCGSLGYSDTLDWATRRATTVLLSCLCWCSAPHQPTANESNYWHIGAWMPTPSPR